MQEAAGDNGQNQHAIAMTVFENSEKTTLGWEPGIAQVEFSEGATVKINSHGKPLDCLFAQILRMHHWTAALPPRGGQGHRRLMV